MHSLFLTPTLLAVISVAVFAHDMWIEPSVFAPKPGQVVSVRLRVGQEFIGDPIPRNSLLIHQFVVEDSTGRKAIPGREGYDPAGFVRANAPGSLVIGYHSKPSAIELPAEAFNTYLKEEGLEAVAATRARRGETLAATRELFTRCAKSLLLSGIEKPDQADRTLGFTLELTAEKNPLLLRDGELLPVQLTYENKPLAGALVVAINRTDPATKLAFRTGKDGRVRFRLPRGGVWMVKAVHMIPASPGADANWESFWASLTFQTTATLLPQTN